MTQLILKRAPIGDNLEDYSVLEAGVVVGRIFFLDAVGQRGAPGCGPAATTATSAARRTATSRRAEAAMEAFKKSWRRE
jgi:hypothetical protein